MMRGSGAEVEQSDEAGAMNTERLNILIDVLQNVEERDLPFDMLNWINGRGCGTAACALGYAALDPRLQAEGLELVGGVREGLKLVVFRTVQEFNDAHSAIHVCPRFLSVKNYSAGAKFFGIHRNASEWLFSPIEYDHTDITPAEVTARIKAVIEAGGKRPRASCSTNWWS